MVIDDAFDGDAHVEIKQFGRAFVSNKFAMQVAIIGMVMMIYHL